MAKEAEHKEGEGEAQPKKKGKLILIVGGVVVLLLLIGVPAVLFMGGGEAPQEGGHEEHEEVEVEPVLKIAKLDQFIVNLGSSNAFLRTTILLEYDQNVIDRIASHGAEGGSAHGGGAGSGGPAKVEPEGVLPAAMKPREPMIRDAIINILTSKNPSDVMNPEGKELLKEQLIEVVNEAIGFDEPAIVNIYFVEFMVQ